MSMHPEASAGVPRQLFFRTADQRAALARQMFFDDGQRPSGLVGEAIIQSWTRCAATHHTPRSGVAFDAISSNRRQHVLQRNNALLGAARKDIDGLEASLAGTGCRVFLLDPTGAVVHATLSRREKLRPFTSSICVGVNIGESVLGTSAPGVVVKTGNACTVKGPEHYFEWLGAFQCAAAPIRDVHGGLAGVLDLTVEVGSFGFDAASVVGQYANAIENQLLQAQSSEHLVLHFQTTPALLGTPLEALAGVTTDGRVVWVNGVAERFIGALEAASERDVEHLIGCSISALLALARQGSPQPVRLLNGLTVWLAARLQARDGVDFRHAVATLPAGPPPEKMEPAPEPNAATLGEHNHKLFERTLAAHGGNVAKTARALGVSRGLVYRRLGLGKPTLTPSEPAGSIPLA